jgi:zinc finger SWIM domain-containing protein 3
MASKRMPIALLPLGHIYHNAAKHLSQVISDDEDFLKDFKHCVYEERSIAHFNKRWQELLTTYGLGQNSWLQNF